MALQFSVAVRNAELDAIETAIGTSWFSRFARAHNRPPSPPLIAVRFWQRSVCLATGWLLLPLVQKQRPVHGRIRRLMRQERLPISASMPVTVRQPIFKVVLPLLVAAAI